MARYSPGSQQRGVMAEKEQIARRLILQGMRDGVIRTQLRCSDTFLRRIRQAMAEESGA